MSKADELAEKLKQSRQTSADATIADQVIDSWPGQVYDLYHQIETWLQPLIEVGLKLRRNATHVFESAPDGTPHDYAIDQLLIDGNHHSITFDPVARFTTDGAGRVEIHSQGKELALLRTVDEHGETHWWLQAIDQSGQQPDAIALTEHNLLLAVQEGLGL
ncbi:hypothetical protein FHW68_000762 [Pseudomonas sp. Tn43]|uniref:hypothetical protein n=1 Tax=unclassified Pseudomonas TaxID=196821 RepID=UPI000BAB4E23|nr:MULTISPECIES: hypothetical protein [unclassified Pseudomonas]MBB3239290.1 hypothetical protein [Pseudomonas sp. Tn43]PAU57362.1 hypothetical protein BZL43_15140 [Pseudomonas sp. PICF141]